MGLGQCDACYGSGMVYEMRRNRFGELVEVHTTCGQCSGSGLMRVNSEYDSEGWWISGNKSTPVIKSGVTKTPKR